MQNLNCITQSGPLTKDFLNVGKGRRMEMGKVGGDRRYRTAMLAVSLIYFLFEFRAFFGFLSIIFVISYRPRPPTPSAYPNLLKERRGNPKIRKN